MEPSNEEKEHREVVNSTEEFEAMMIGIMESEDVSTPEMGWEEIYLRHK
jgi:imidazoleglycerol phosphate synthase glutamine amidotransferase subunit HisH